MIFYEGINVLKIVLFFDFASELLHVMGKPRQMCARCRVKKIRNLSIAVLSRLSWCENCLFET